MRSEPAAIESLAHKLFRRDHPERIWRPGAPDVFAQRAAGVASAEERTLYRAFARTQLYEPIWRRRSQRA